MAGVPLVRVIRSGLEESVHAGDVAVVDGAGKVTMWAGDPDRLLFARSSMKPLQATVSLSQSPFDFSDKEVAVMCASHNAEPLHVEAVRSLLARAGVDEEALQCPAMRPWDDETAGADPERRRINSDCSGKHGGMLAACVAQGWPTYSYRTPEHPLQKRVMEAVLQATGLDTVRVGVDGCGVPVHGLPLRSMATIYARLSTPDRWGSLAPFADHAVRAMRGEPYLVAGRNRVDTAVMQVAPGILVKGGAEGLICAALIDIGLGVAVKVADGAHRAAGSALIHTLHSMDRLEQTQVEHLAPYARPPVLGGGEPVGEIQPVFSLAQN
jgi:L-asparaginase II